MDNTSVETRKGVTGAGLKWIALVTMLIDHIGAVFCEEIVSVSGSNIPYWIMRGIGRIAFPIFCFLLVEGYVHTGNRLKYGLRLFCFAVISEIPFDLAFWQSFVNWNYENVFFTLALGLLAMFVLDYFKENPWLQLGLVCCAMVLAEVCRTDYGGAGVLLIVGFYFFRGNELARGISAFLILVFLMNILEAVAMIDFLPIHFYNGKRGRQLKYFFYIFYPAHLLFLWWIHGWIIR